MVSLNRLAACCLNAYNYALFDLEDVFHGVEGLSVNL